MATQTYRASVQVKTFKWPACPACGTEMAVQRIEPDQPGYDKRTFKCPHCGQDTVEVVAI